MQGVLFKKIFQSLVSIILIKLRNLMMFYILRCTTRSRRNCLSRLRSTTYQKNGTLNSPEYGLISNWKVLKIVEVYSGGTTNA